MNIEIANFKIHREFKGSRASRVFLVEDPQSGVLQVHKTVFLCDRNRETQEVAVHSALSHPHIIKLLRSERVVGRMTMLIEYARHGDLFGWLNRLHGLETRRILQFFGQVVSAVSYIHQQGFAHRDIKPENVLIGKRFSPRLADFGSSTRIADMGSSFCGTLDYMAPEVLSRLPQTEKVDVWALGVLLYEMFHLCSPFRSMEVAKIIRCVDEGRIAFKENLDPEVQNLITRMLRSNPAHRPAADDILDHSLFQPDQSSHFPATFTLAGPNTYNGLPEPTKEAQATGDSAPVDSPSLTAANQSLAVVTELRASEVQKSITAPKSNLVLDSPQNLNIQCLYSLKNLMNFKSRCYSSGNALLGHLKSEVEKYSSQLSHASTTCRGPDHKLLSTERGSHLSTEPQTPPLTADPELSDLSQKGLSTLDAGCRGVQLLSL
jgi:serine/threonine protein kinase